MRLAIISTPRSGNTWLRALASFMYQVPHLSAHRPARVDWSALPAECVFQLHWHYDPDLVRLLDEHGFRVATLARHPLDVLMSILQFARHADTDGWLDARGGDERMIVGVEPTSTALARYATGPRFGALLAATRDWWDVDGVFKVRYEDLVARPRGELERLEIFLGADAAVRIVDAVDAADVDRMRGLASPGHVWQGTPGLWKRLLPADLARAVAAAHPESFEGLGYACDADVALTPDAAAENWHRLVT